MFYILTLEYQYSYSKDQVCFNEKFWKPAFGLQTLIFNFHFAELPAGFPDYSHFFQKSWLPPNVSNIFFYSNVLCQAPFPDEEREHDVNHENEASSWKRILGNSPKLWAHFPGKWTSTSFILLTLPHLCPCWKFKKSRKFGKSDCVRTRLRPSCTFLKKDSSRKINAEGANESIKSQKSHVLIWKLRFFHTNPGKSGFGEDTSGFDEGTSGLGAKIEFSRTLVKNAEIRNQ